MNILNTINLVRAYIIENKLRLLIGSSIIFLFAILGFSTSAMPEIAPSVPYIFLFFLVCFTIFGIKNNRAHFFTLPVSTVEKFIFTIAVILILGVVFQTIEIVGASIGRYLILPYFRSEIHTHGYSFLSLNILNLKGYLKFAAYMSVFLFGSIYFNKNAFLKTIGILIGFGFSIGLYVLGLTLIAFGELKNQGMVLIDKNLINISFWESYWYILPIAVIAFFLSLTYLRLRETEV
jgi:hypothetical protein